MVECARAAVRVVRRLIGPEVARDRVVAKSIGNQASREKGEGD